VIVVDASLALKLVLDEPDSLRVRSLWQAWANNGEALCAPTLFRAETISAVRRRVFRRLLSEEEGREAYEVLDNLSVEIGEPDDLYEVALQYAQRFDRSTIYDSCYLALADIIGCDLWTADGRLANAARALTWVRLP
jgi:predicted nucleic acid-binding protein